MSVLADLGRLGSAEEFFAYLGIEADPAIVRVARLHILRRMGEYLRKESFDGLDEEEVRDKCRGLLETAYTDFLKSSPLQERVFKVLKDAVKPKPEKKIAFVPLASLGKKE